MKTALIAVAGLLLCAAPALAQTAGPAPDAHKLELAHELIDAIHLEKMMDGMTGSIQKSLAASMTAQASKGDQAKASAMLDASQEEMRELTPKLIDYMTVVYARELTEKELKDSLTFYHSDSGQSILAKTPALIQQMTPFMQQQMPQIIRGMFRRYCVKVTCTTQETAQFNKISEAMTPKS